MSVIDMLTILEGYSTTLRYGSLRIRLKRISLQIRDDVKVVTDSKKEKNNNLPDGDQNRISEKVEIIGMK